MNERVMQFRIGMFVIVAGLVLTMLIVWFGESPSLFRAQDYVTVHYAEAPGVAEGIPVRKSGIRVGEVASIRFDDRPKVKGAVVEIQESVAVVDLGSKGKGIVPLDQFQGTYPDRGDSIDVLINRKEPESGFLSLSLPDGVLVTLALERKYKLKAGSTPRISRALIGDVSIDLMPGSGQGALPTSSSPLNAPVIEGSVAPDPSNALAAATEAFEKVGGTLESIDRAAQGVAMVARKAEDLDQFIDSWNKMGNSVSSLATDIQRVVRDNEENVRPAIANIREVSQKINTTLDEKTQANLRSTASQLASGSARLDRVLSEIEPLAQDLGAKPGTNPKTNFGQVLMRVNLLAYDIGLITQTLRDPNGGLNRNGTIQKLLTDSTLHDNFNQLAIGGQGFLNASMPILRNLGKFAERIASDPGALTRGALQPR